MTDSIEKKLLKNEPPNPYDLFIQIPFAKEGETEVVRSIEPDDSVSWQKGFTQAYEMKVGTQGAKSIERKKDNYLKYVFSALLKIWQTETFPQAFKGKFYIKNTIVRVGDDKRTAYFALKDTTLKEIAIDWQELILERAITNEQIIGKATNLLMTPSGTDILINNNIKEYRLGYPKEWRSNQTYNKFAVVSSVNGILLYVSLQSKNIGNEVTNTDYWRQVFLQRAILEKEIISTSEEYLMTPKGTVDLIKNRVANYFIGLPKNWDTATNYKKYAIVCDPDKFSGMQYVSLQDGNQGNAVTSPTWWQKLVLQRALKDVDITGGSDDFLMTPKGSHTLVLGYVANYLSGLPRDWDKNTVYAQNATVVGTVGRSKSVYFSLKDDNKNPVNDSTAWQKLVLQRALTPDQIGAKTDDFLMTPKGTADLIVTYFGNYNFGVPKDWDKNTTYAQNATVFGSDGQINTIYFSLQSGNTGHVVTEDKWWQKLVLQKALTPDQIGAKTDDFLMTPKGTTDLILTYVDSYNLGVPKKWIASNNYPKNATVTGTVGTTNSVYFSLKDDNKGQQVSDEKWWQKLVLQRALKIEEITPDNDDLLMTPKGSHTLVLGYVANYLSGLPRKWDVDKIYAQNATVVGINNNTVYFSLQNGNRSSVSDEKWWQKLVLQKALTNDQIGSNTNDFLMTPKGSSTLILTYVNNYISGLPRDWDKNTVYAQNATVVGTVGRSKSVYFSLKDDNQSPVTDTTAWQKLVLQKALTNDQIGSDTNDFLMTPKGSSTLINKLTKATMANYFNGMPTSWQDSTTYAQNATVFGNDGKTNAVYFSLQSGNTGHSISNTTWWQKLVLQKALTNDQIGSDTNDFLMTPKGSSTLINKLTKATMANYFNGMPNNWDKNNIYAKNATVIGNDGKTNAVYFSLQDDNKNPVNDSTAWQKLVLQRALKDVDITGGSDDFLMTPKGSSLLANAVITTTMANYFKGMPNDWNNTKTYSKNSTVVGNIGGTNSVYFSLKDANKGIVFNDPEWWQKLVLQKALTNEQVSSNSDEFLMTPKGSSLLANAVITTTMANYFKGMPTIWNKNTVYDKNAAVVGTDKGANSVYFSLKDNNKSAVIDTAEWQKLVLQKALTKDDITGGSDDFLMTPKGSSTLIKSTMASYFNGMPTRWDTNTTYNRKATVIYTVSEGEINYFTSLQNNNIGKPVTDTKYWQPLIVQTATKAEAETGTATEVLMTPFATKAAIDKFVPKPDVVPIGSMFCFAAPIAPPGYLLCDGSKQKKVDYPILFNVIKDCFGNSDATTFTLPDMQGYTARGFDPNHIVDPDPNRIFGSKQDDSLKAHDHGITDKAHTHKAEAAPHTHDLLGGHFDGHVTKVMPDLVDTVSFVDLTDIVKPANVTIKVSSDPTGITKTNSFGEAETRMKNVALSWIIKAQ